MQKHNVALFLLSAMLLCACGSKKDANERNFAAAMRQYLDKRGELCLGLEQWPVTIKEGYRGISPKSSEAMAALEAAGLLKGEDDEEKTPDWAGTPRNIKVRRYTLTEAAKPYAKNQDLCWGKKALDKIVKWEGPMKLGDYQEAEVTYTYRIENVADWARKPDIQAAIPEIHGELDGVGQEDRHVVKLTSQGWEAKDSSW